MTKWSLAFFCLTLMSLNSQGAHPSDVGRYFIVLRDLKVPIYRKANQGLAILTQETLQLTRGQFVKVDRVDEQNSWIELRDSEKRGNSNDFAVIPDITYSFGDSYLGDRYSIPLTSLQPFTPVFDSHNPSTIKVNLGIFRELSNIVYYDSIPGRRVSLTKKPESDHIRCDDKAVGGNPCVGWPTTGDGMLVIDAKAQYVLNAMTDRYEPKLFYKVVVNYCPRKDHSCMDNEKRRAKGWVRADSVGFTKRDPVPGVLRHDRFGGPEHLFGAFSPTTEEALVNSQKESFTVVGQCTGNAYVKAYEKVLSDIKFQLEQSNDQNSKSMFNEIAAQEIKKLGTSVFGATKTKSSPFNSVIKNLHKTMPHQARRDSSITDDELKAIDALARTLYGEVRGCINENDTGYAKAIARVIYNRAAHVHHHGNPPDANWVSVANPGKPGDPISRLIVEVVGNDRQFSIFNPSDPNLKHAFCPDRYSSQWRASVDVAYHVIKKTKDFLRETDGIYQTRYYSHMDPAPWKDGKSKTKFVIGNVTYGTNSLGDILSPIDACVTLFSDKKDGEIARITSGDGI